MSMGPSIFYKICEAPLASGFEHRTDVRDHRHFGERDGKTAVGDVVTAVTIPSRISARTNSP